MKAVSRRSLLGGAAGAVSLTVLGASHADAAVQGRRASAPLRSDYVGSTGRVFTARAGGRTVRLRLTSVRDVTHTPEHERSRCFILVFAPVAGVSVPDAIYTLRRRGVQTHRLFLSSLGTENAMQAVINRPT